MDFKVLATVFTAIFIAELGDKTQIATMLFASNSSTSKWIIFWGASLALMATTALGILLGGVLAQYVNPKALTAVAGTGFILIGIWTLYQL